MGLKQKTKICILATAENVDAIRTTAYDNIPSLSGHALLNFPVSATGKEPITHWACSLNASDELKDKLLELKNLSDMELNMNLREFLESKSLLLVRS